MRGWVDGNLRVIICKMRIIAGWFENEMTYPCKVFRTVPVSTHKAQV